MTISWPWATWFAPVVPSLAFWALLGTDLDGAGEGDTWTRLGLIGLLAMVVGALAARVAGPRVGGLGIGLCTGGAAVLVSAVVLVIR